MTQKHQIQLFEEKKVRTVWNDELQEWFFNVTDVVEVLTDSVDVKQYIKKMRKRDPELDARWGTICTPTRMQATDGKYYNTQAATMEGVFRIIQSIPSKKAEPFKQWMAEVSAQRIDQMQDPELNFEQAYADFPITIDMNKFELMALPYAPDALEPVISKETIGFHHGKHLAAYVDNLNKLLPGSGYEGVTLEEIMRKAPTGAVFNNAGQILNHELYFSQFKPAGEAAQRPEGALAAQIEKQWGSMEAFKTEFEAKGVGLFGSGWVWLSADADGSLVITQEQGASNPVVKGLKPLLTFDVWEHAYYLDYQNRRAAHLSALWQIVDWKVIADRYE